MGKNDLQKYRYASLAAELVGQEDFTSAGISLEHLAKDLNCSDEIKPYIDGALASEDGIKIAALSFAKRYTDVYKKASVKDLWEIYQKEAGLNEAEKSIYGSRINAVGNSKLEDVKKTIDELRTKLKNVLDGKMTLSENELLALNNKLKNYQETMGILGNLEQYSHITLIEPIQKEAIKRQKKKIKSELERIVGL
jgi:hypothetical protein